MSSGFSAVGLLIFALAATPNPPTKVDPRGPLHPADDPAGPAVEPMPYFYSDLMRYIEDNKPIQGPFQNRYEAECYELMFLHARRLPDDLLHRAATSRINFFHLFGDDRDTYRGALVHIEGRLKLLRRYDPPRTLRDDSQGLTEMYEGWIFIEEFGGNPYCVVCSNLGKGLEPAEKIDREVETDAFFFKRYAYETREHGKGNTNVWRYAPFLIANSIRPKASPKATAASVLQVPGAVLAGVFGLIGASLAIGVGLVWWFRREDKRVRARLKKATPGAFSGVEEFLAGEPDEFPRSFAERGPFGNSPSNN